MTTQREHDQLKKTAFDLQKGECGFCLKGRYCPDCSDGKVHTEHRWQEVNTLDHNHDHIGCKGCIQCIRGVVHRMCNWNVIPLLQRNPHLISDWAKAYLKRGSGPYTNGVDKSAVKARIVAKKSFRKSNNLSKSMLDFAVDVLKDNGDVWSDTISALWKEIEKRGHQSNGDTPANSLNTKMFYTTKGKRLFKKENSSIYLIK